MTHQIRIVSGGPSHNHTLWQCDRCRKLWDDTHEWESGYIKRNSTNAENEKCPGKPVKKGPTNGK